MKFLEDYLTIGEYEVYFGIKEYCRLHKKYFFSVKDLHDSIFNNVFNKHSTSNYITRLKKKKIIILTKKYNGNKMNGNVYTINDLFINNLKKFI